MVDSHLHLHPAPYTLHPTPYTLHSTPYTLHPTRVFAIRTHRDPQTPDAQGILLHWRTGCKESERDQGQVKTRVC
jgi:hypothetical protein